MAHKMRQLSVRCGTYKEVLCGSQVKDIGGIQFKSVKSKLYKTNQGPQLVLINYKLILFMMRIFQTQQSRRTSNKYSLMFLRLYELITF